MREKTKKNPINNKEFRQEILSYKKTGIISNKLGIMLKTIASMCNSSHKFNKYRIDIQKDMQSDAVLMMMECLGKFNCNKTNPFSYFMTICYNSFLYYLKRRYKDINFNQELIEDFLIQNQDSCKGFKFSKYEKEEEHGG